MVQGQDPSALQAWLIAIPSAITAVSTWYINRKTKTTVTKSEKAITVKSDASASEIAQLKARVAFLEQAIKRFDGTVATVRDCQITLAQKYTESMNALQVELKGQRRAFERANPVKTEPEAAEESAPEVEIELEDSEPKASTDEVAPKPNFGKVKWEK